MDVRGQLEGGLTIKWREAWTRADVMDMGKRRHIRRLRNKMDIIVPGMGGHVANHTGREKRERPIEGQ